MLLNCFIAASLITGGGLGLFWVYRYQHPPGTLEQFFGWTFVLLATVYLFSSPFVVYYNIFQKPSAAAPPRISSDKWPASIFLFCSAFTFFTIFLSLVVIYLQEQAQDFPGVNPMLILVSYMTSLSCSGLLTKMVFKDFKQAQKNK